MHKRKEQNHMEGQSLFFFCQRYFQKKGCVIEKVFKGPCSINCQNNLLIQYVVQMVNISSLSKIKLAF